MHSNTTSRSVFSLTTLASLALLLAAEPARSQLFGLSSESDVEQGMEVAKMVADQIGLCSQPETESFLRGVGGRLVTVVNDSRWKFSFQIVDQAEPNAFAIPGGGLYVSRGLLALVNREDELAGVLGHEIAHVTERHSARQQRRGILPGLLSLPGNVVGGVVSEDLGNLINAPIDTVGGAWLSRYSRGQESDADRIGIRTAADAGYDPAALADFLARLDQDVKSQTGVERKFSMFDSHPMTETRLKDIRRRAENITPKGQPRIAGDARALYAKLEGLWWGENPENGVFHKEQFLQPVIGFTITFPTGWTNRNSPQYVLSSHPNKEAVLLLGIAGPASDPEATGRKFIERMRSKARIEPISTRSQSLGQFPAFVATYLDKSGRMPTYLYLLWVSMGDKTYQLIGMAPERHRETLRNAALTLRPLTDAERRTVTGKRLRIVSAAKGERLENLSARTGNVWSPAYTALVNGLDAETDLKEGQLLKIARLEPVDR